MKSAEDSDEAAAAHITTKNTPFSYMSLKITTSITPSRTTNPQINSTLPGWNLERVGSAQFACMPCRYHWPT